MACVSWYKWKERKNTFIWTEKREEKDENEYSIHNKWQNYTGPLG